MAKHTKEKRPPPTPKALKPWDVPPPPGKGDDDPEVLYAAVGRALSNWSALENTLGSIFSMLVTPSEGEIASRAFGSILTFRGKKEMIEAAAEAFFFTYPDTDGKVEPYLKDLLTETHKFSNRRNEIAHGIVQQNTPPVRSKHLEDHIAVFGMTVPKIDPKYPLGYVLRPTNHASNKTTMEKGRVLLVPVIYVPDYVYASPEVMRFSEHFDRLHKFAIKFPWAILGHRDRAKARSSS